MGWNDLKSTHSTQWNFFPKRSGASKRAQQRAERSMQKSESRERTDGPPARPSVLRVDLFASHPSCTDQVLSTFWDIRKLVKIPTLSEKRMLKVLHLETLAQLIIGWVRKKMTLRLIYISDRDSWHYCRKETHITPSLLVGSQPAHTWENLWRY